MASKKKTKKKGSARAAKKAKPKRSTRAGGGAASRAKPKKGARKASARKAGARKAGASKAGARKAGARKAGARKAVARARTSGAKRAPVRKVEASVTRSEPVILDEVLEEPLLDASTILRVKDRVARSQRDVDEDALKQFSDPSQVIDVDTSDFVPVEDADADEPSGLFAAEARRQQAARAAETRPATSGGTPKRHDGSLFGALAGDSDEDSDEPDED